VIDAKERYLTGGGGEGGGGGGGGTGVVLPKKILIGVGGDAV
jgi:hypothetical protein